MADTKRPDPETPELEQNPSEPKRKRPSDRGVGLDHATPPPAGDSSPTSKTPG